ncbi:hypothetical protein QBC42DRAFT_272501 [Cladorrhinum samala]|uniref:Uncharacterized protein n=1 Tax=Cladorrhinum samala TaxID=585594 RepID=A0AAV9HIL7_9PEZI|nr:hypothetical protein QBC42DRAFT_272501 [Cladorrhinum samala]
MNTILMSITQTTIAMQLTAVFSLLLTAASASAGSITKRCSPARDPEWYNGYLPPAPCWQTFNTACQPFLRSDTQMTIDAPHNLVIVYGVDQSCAATIKEELARELDGRKTYGWQQQHGKLTLIDGGILVISNMTAQTVERYGKLTTLQM